MANESKREVRGGTLAAIVAADVTTLLAGRSWPGELGRAARAPHAYLAAHGSDPALLVLAGTALWVAALWLAFGLAAAAASRLPGRPGRCGALVARAVLPRVVARLCATTLGAGVLLAPAAALAAPAHPVPAHAAATLRPAAAVAARNPVTTPVPTPTWPTSTPSAGSATVPTPSWPQGGSRPAAPSQPAPPAAPPQSARSGDTTVRVQPGDSLWLIAARRLGPGATPVQIATATQDWYAANRTVIGAEPGLIHPGQVLHPPADAS